MDQHRLNIDRVAAALRAPAGGTSDFDLNPLARPAVPPPLRAASVLVPLIERGSRLHVILTRRAARLRHHPGQIAFPGGKQDHDDPSPLAAALREAREEIGLDAAAVTILGTFDRHETVTRFSVTPFVGLVAPGFVPVIDPGEVEEVFEVPLAFVLDPANRQTHRREWPGGWRVYQAIPYGPHYIWGATARMLATLGDRVGGAMTEAIRLDAPWLGQPGPARVMALIGGAGHRAYFVGGCVRNALIGGPVTDIDIATDARPEVVADLAAAQGVKAVPTGLAHGTVTLLIGGRPFEVTTFRRDVETFGRRATVAFTDVLAEDAGRRDFTLNALYADADGLVLDPLGTGLADLAERRVRFVGDPALRIAEDYLRIPRFFRFHAWYADPAGGLDAEALAACAAGQEGLGQLSRERVGAEVRKLLAAPDPAPAVAAMAATGILARLLPGADPRCLAPLVAMERAAGIAPEWPRRLAILGSAADWAEALRLSRAELRRLRGITAALAAPTPAAAAYSAGPDAARDAALIAAASIGAPPPAGLEAAILRGAAARLPVRPADLPLAGPALGRAMRAIEADWLASDLTLDAAALLARR